MLHHRTNAKYKRLMSNIAHKLHTVKFPISIAMVTGKSKRVLLEL